MKKFSAVAFFGLAFAIFAHADIIYPDGTTTEVEPYVIKKLARGFANVVLAPLELPKTLYDATYEGGVMNSEVMGLEATRAPYRMMTRYASGFYDLGTAFFHDKPLLHLEPEYIGLGDVIPGYSTMFNWGTIDTSAAPH